MELKPIPAKLRQILESRQIRKVEDVLYDTAKKYNGTGASTYGQRALDEECARLREAQAGTRHDTTRDAAFAIGRLVAGGEIEHGHALAELTKAAVDCGASDDDINRTLPESLEAGMDHPRASKMAGDGEVTVGETWVVEDCPDPALLWVETPGVFELTDYRPEDGGILDLWFDLYGAQRMFAVGLDDWFTWCGSHWCKDDTLSVVREVELLIDRMNQQARQGLAEAIEKEDKKFWGKYVNATQRTKNRVASVEGMARARCAVATGIINTGNTLNLRNGVLDLDTFQLRSHEQGDNFTYCLPYDYDPAATCPRFERFVSEVLVKENTTETDGELCALYQESMGYALTNDTRHEAMFWFSGDGGNGKTVAITMIQKLLGPLCFSVSFEEMGRAGNYDLAEVAGKRVIFSTESERGGKLAEGHIKRIVSGERINARPIYGSPFEFQSTAKIFWAMNDLPVIKDTSNGVWRRLKLFPFHRTFTEKDKDPGLIQKLEAELSGILNYALEGLKRLRERGHLPESSAVIAAVDEYRHENNPVQQWMDERTQPSYTPGQAPTSYPTTAKTLFDDYKAWAESNGRLTMNSTNFGREMRRLRIPKDKDVRGIVYALELV